MVQRAEEKANFGWGKAAWSAFVPLLLLGACQSTPTELASDLAEPAVVTASAGPADAQTADIAPAARPEPEASRPRELVSIPSQRRAAVEIEQLQAPNQAPHGDTAPEPPPQTHASAAREKLRIASKSESASGKTAAAPAPKSAAPTKLAEASNSETAAPAKTAGAFEWPVEGKILENYGADKDGQRNDGINIAADAGTPIHAAANGTVTYASNLKGYGNLVLIRHTNGYITAYAHAEKLLVSAGDQVGRGDVIGYAGKSGGVGTPQLHFEIRKGTKPVDPRPLMTGRES
ncbi:MAG TPA: M23 family metallopeptidase [Rhizomicrobium sp.]|jgi:murein DD-endopeptidase MepM/ murein hydrolase activator NlpD|nr:M23 family metallopeptidase [Rhizomicrobium sp.]